MRQVVMLSVVAFIVIVSIFVFIAFPNAVELFSFSGRQFLGGEFWRYITFSFVHFDLKHLVQNMTALVLVTMIAYEFRLQGKDFLLIFLTMAFSLALIESLLFPTLTLAGTSLGIYAVLGALATKGSKYIPRKIFIPILVVSVFLDLSYFLLTDPSRIGPWLEKDLIVSLFHLAGFFLGIGAFYLITMTKKRERVFSWS